MYEQVKTIIRKSVRLPEDKMNVLCAPTHERYAQHLEDVNVNFYMYNHPTFKTWDYRYAPLPKNRFWLNKDLGDFQLPMDIQFDAIMAEHKYSQWQVLTPIAQKYRIPVVFLEHTWAVNFSKQQILNWKEMKSDVNVFISEASRDIWNYSSDEAEVIYHGIKTDLFKPADCEKSLKPLSVVNKWQERDVPCGYNWWREATKDIETVVVGDNPGLSLPANGVEDLVSKYQSHYIFVNTSLQSPIPYALIEACAAGMCVISTATCMIPEFIRNNETGLLANTPEEMNNLIKMAQNDVEMCKELGRNARKMAEKRFSLTRFTNEWNNIFERFK